MESIGIRYDIASIKSSHRRFGMAQSLVWNLQAVCFGSWQACNLRCQGSGSLDFTLISWVSTFSAIISLDRIWLHPSLLFADGNCINPEVVNLDFWSSVWEHQKTRIASCWVLISIVLFCWISWLTSKLLSLEQAFDLRITVLTLRCCQFFVVMGCTITVLSIYSVSSFVNLHLSAQLSAYVEVGCLPHQGVLA